MDVKAINEILRDDAISNGLCAQWQSDWREDWDAQKMVDKYKEGIDFCIKHGYPGNEFIKQNFPKELLRENAVLVDDRWSLLNQKTCVLLGNSESTIRYNGRTVGSVYVKDNSRCTITAKVFSFCLVHAFDNARINCEATEQAAIVIIKHSEKVIVDKSMGNIRVRKELDYLGNNNIT